MYFLYFSQISTRLKKKKKFYICFLDLNQGH